MEKIFDLERVLKVITIGTIIFAIFIFIVELIYRPIDKVLNEQTVTVTVKDKNVKRVHGRDKYLVYTNSEDSDTQVFEVTDSLWKGRFDSSDLYGAIDAGKTYKFTVCGSRMKIMSWYPNIYKAKEVK